MEVLHMDTIVKTLFLKISNNTFFESPQVQKNQFVDVCNVLLLAIEKEAVIHVSITELAKKLHKWESEVNEPNEVKKTCIYVYACV